MEKKVKKIQKTYKRVLTIAGSDSGGGAGIQADLKSIAANGCYGMSVITALTAQNTKGVFGIYPVPVDFVQQQLQVVLSDIGSNAIKIGMLFSSELIEMIASELQAHLAKNIVLDPVMVATSGDKLLKDEAVEALRTHLIPLAHLITPNLPEASVLLGREITTLGELKGAAVELSELGCPNVLIKGGHLEEGDCDDLLYLAETGEVCTYPVKRIETNNNHGTGCTLSSAIAAGLAKGLSVEEAVAAGKEYITGAIRSGADYKIGGGHGPVDHFYKFF
jgi:hydroxymethylpyrimidine/phosphomethylpyrimidine kinase